VFFILTKLFYSDNACLIIGFVLADLNHIEGSVPDAGWVVEGVRVNLFHVAKLDDSHGSKNKKSLSDIFVWAFKKKKELSWFYSIVSDHVLIKAGNLVIKSSIHRVDKNIKFIRVPRLGNVLVEGTLLRKPMSGEELLIKKFLASKKISLIK